MTAEAAAFAAPVTKAERAARLRVVAGWLWSGALLAVLTFLVIYPVAMLLLGALTDTNPVVDGFGAVRPLARQLPQPCSATRMSPRRWSTR